MTFEQKRYAEHGLKPGRQVIRLTGTRPDGGKVNRLYLYDTAAYIEKDMGKLVDCRCEYVAWDGIEKVSCYNGD